MKICFLADTHLIDEYSVFNDNLDNILGFIRQNDFDAVVHLGDVAADGVTRPSQLRFAAESHKALTTAIYYVPGNHDVGDDLESAHHSGQRLLDLERLAEFRQLFGPDYWAFEAPGWRIFGLNSQLFGSGSEAEEAQFAWLGEQLAGETAALGIALHKPLLPHEDPAAPLVRYVPERARWRLFELFAGRDLKFVVSGHVHQQRRFVVDEIEHIWVPSASFCMPDALQARVGDKVVGVTTLELREDGSHRFEHRSVEGLVRHNLLDRPEIYPSVAATRARLSDDQARL